MLSPGFDSSRSIWLMCSCLMTDSLSDSGSSSYLIEAFIWLADFYCGASGRNFSSSWSSSKGRDSISFSMRVVRFELTSSPLILWISSRRWRSVDPWEISLIGSLLSKVPELMGSWYTRLSGLISWVWRIFYMNTCLATWWESFQSYRALLIFFLSCFLTILVINFTTLSNFLDWETYDFICLSALFTASF